MTTINMLLWQVIGFRMKAQEIKLSVLFGQEWGQSQGAKSRPQASLNAFNDASADVASRFSFFLNLLLSKRVDVAKWFSTPKLGNSEAMMLLASLTQLTILPWKNK